jgi:hypothetical protein
VPAFEKDVIHFIQFPNAETEMHNNVVQRSQQQEKRVKVAGRFGPASLQVGSRLDA